MRIGILTLPLHTNYGGILQAYALQTVLERMGHEVEVFDRSYTFHIPFWKKCLAYPKRILCKYVLRRHTIVRWEKYATHVNLVTRQYTQSFIEGHIKRKAMKSLSEVRPDDYDAIVVGSDQIWRPMYFQNIANAFLDFTRGWKIKRVAYAPSFGVDKWEYNEKQTCVCKELLSKFDAVSVRESSGVQLCEKYLGRSAEWVFDPTLLLQVDDYKALYEQMNTPKSKGTLLNYILDASAESERLIKTVSEQMGLVPFRVNSRIEDVTASLEERVQPPVEQWLRGFNDAQYIVTDSFHACVFSILFQKPFVVYANEKRGMSRIESLLGFLGLENRIVRDVYDAGLLEDINYAEVYIKLDEMRRISLDFLESSLKNLAINASL